MRYRVGKPLPASIFGADGLAQLLFDDFAELVARQGVDDDEVFGMFVAAQAQRMTVPHQGFQ